MNELFWKVGELAAETGVTVRTLHWYDEIGLLRPTHRTASGHRVYEADDVGRLLRIRSLQALGLSLEEVKGVLSGNDHSPRELLVTQIARLRTRIDEERRLCSRLERLLGALDTNAPADPEDLFAAIKEMQMIERIESYYTPEQLETLSRRREALGEDHIEAVQKEWPAVMRRIQEEMQRGADPNSPEVKKLVARHQELLHQFHGGDPGIIESMKELYRGMGSEITKKYDFPMSEPLGDFMKKAAEDGAAPASE